MIIANPAVEGMGTTLTALFWSDGHVAVCHIGDSRGYLLRAGELYQITHDHTLATCWRNCPRRLARVS